ncbi:DUF302 domain-containing protein [Thalassobaculum litoreum]|uniref:Uncharacterized conserved protein, DUF302 family n=1 Tax=Thalassobaculum litoreum DSM 18839 TaxID=1123362 RepID=A0A8G2F3R6_9PROT|nr:DUF302 domain-containing protein [Thalassobaculum litoreum]SDF95900.1 Uncharacterized conserved protein, DUF302 family [Thalassobaculum litoreum DSM 18839]
MRALLLVLLLALASPAVAETPGGTVTVDTHRPFAAYIDALPKAIGDNGFNIVGISCATCAIRNAFNEAVPGNRVFLFFRPDYARRMLRASTAAGIEAPIRLYVTETEDGTARVTYRRPSQVFGAYGIDDLTAMGRELDVHVATILKTAGEAG